MTYAKAKKKQESNLTKTVKKVIVKNRDEVAINLKVEEPKVRYLKMRAFFRESSWGFFDQSPPEILPELRLKGNWLENAGFSPDDYVSVTAMTDLLIIRRCKT